MNEFNFLLEGRKIMKNALEQYDSMETARDKKNYFEECLQLMDEELYDTLMVNLSTEESDRVFLKAYSVLHNETFTEEFFC
jgi:hypothetical protein